MKIVLSKKRHFFMYFLGLLCSVCLCLLLLFTVISKANVIKPLNLSQKQLLILSNYMYLDDGYELISVTDQLNSYKTDGYYDKIKE